MLEILINIYAFSKRSYMVITYIHKTFKERKPLSNSQTFLQSLKDNYSPEIAHFFKGTL